MPDPAVFLVFDSLTNKQHEALALAAQQLTSKQIALELGVAPVTIDKRIDGIRARCGNLSRSDLSRLYRSWCETYDRTIDEPTILDEEHFHPSLLPEQLPGSPFSFHDSVAFDARASWDRGLPLLRPGLTPSDLGVGGKLFVMLVGAAAIMMVAVLSVAFVDALMSILLR